MVRYYAANMAGPYHLDNGIPCQDSFYIKKDGGGVVYASVADGLGSEAKSDDGSRIASRISCEYCMERYKSGMPFPEVKKLLNNAFVTAYKAVLDEAQAAGNSADEYDTTLCMVIFDNGYVFYGQSGDSGIVALMSSGEYVQLTVQQRDEDGYVFPLCSGPDMWVFGEVEAPVAAVMLMTDGVWEQICPPLLRNNDVKVNVALASRFMDRHEFSLRSVKALEEAAGKFLEGYPRELLDDDKTVVVVYDPLKPAKRMPAEYYSPPDWERLREAAEAKINAASTGRTREGEASGEQSGEQSDEGDGDCAEGEQSAAARRINAVAKLRDLPAVALLIAFSAAAFVMNGFVKEHAPVTYLGIFLVCFIANSTVLLPAPSILVVLQYSMLLNPTAVAVCGALGASLGEMVGFFTGVCGSRFVSGRLVGMIERRFPAHPYIFVFIFAALPLPLFDVVGMIAGAVRLNKFKFYLTCLAGKLIKMLTFVRVGQALSDIIPI